MAAEKYISTDEDRMALLDYANNAKRSDKLKFEILRFMMDSTMQGHMQWDENYHMRIYGFLIQIGKMPSGMKANLKKTKNNTTREKII